MRKALFFLFFLQLFHPFSAFAATAPHHIYVGIYSGRDSQNEAAGGWDNEGQVLNGQYTGSSYSVDRKW